MLNQKDVLAVVEGIQKLKDDFPRTSTPTPEPTAAPDLDDIYDIYEEVAAQLKITHKPSSQAKSQAKAEVKERKERTETEELRLTTADIARMHGVDYYRNNHLVKWLKKQNCLDLIQNIYYCKNSKEVVILCKDHDKTTAHAAATKLTVDFLSAYCAKTGAKGVTPQEMSKAVMPGRPYMQLLGIKLIPFEKDSIQKENALYDQEAAKIEGNVDLKLPYLKKEDADKVFYYVIRRLDKLGFNPELFEDIDNLPTLDELLATEPAPPKDFDLEKYSGIVRPFFSDQAHGRCRVLTKNFESMLRAVAELPCRDQEFAKTKIEELRMVQPAVVMGAEILQKILHAEFGDAPTITVGKPKICGKQVILPTEFDLPVLKSDMPEYIVMFIDISGSMLDGSIYKYNSKKEPIGVISDKDSRIDAVRKAIVNILPKIAQMPNVKLSVIAYDHRVKNTIVFEDLNPDNVDRLQTKVFEDLNIAWDGRTAILPPLEAFRTEHVPKMKACAENYSKAKQLPITALLLTDGIFGDRGSLPAYLEKHFKGSEALKINWKCLGLDLNPGSAPDTDLSRFVQLSQQMIGPEAGQKIFCPRGLVDTKITNLIFGDVASLETLKALQVNFLDPKDTSIRPAVLGTCHLVPDALGTTIFRNVGIPKNVWELILSSDVSLPINYNFEYSDGQKISLKALLQSKLFLSPQAIEGREKAHYLKNEWIQQQILNGFLREGDEIAELRLRNYAEANAAQDKEMMEEVLSQLEPFLKSWKAQNIDKTYKNKKIKLDALIALRHERELESPHDLLDELLSKEIEILQNDVGIKIEESLYKNAGVTEQSEFESLPLGNQLAAYQAVKWMIELNQIAVSEQDKKGMVEQLEAKENALWHDFTLCELSGCNTMADFAKLPVVKCFEIYEKATEKAESHSMKVVGEQLQQEMDKIWLKVQYDLAGYKSDLAAAKQLEILEKIQEKAHKLGKENDVKTLESQIDAIWLKGYKCQVAGISDVKEFESLPMLKRFDILETMLQAAEERKKDADINAVRAEMNPIWLNAQLCKVAMISEIALFSDLSLERQLTSLDEVGNRALKVKREVEFKTIEERKPSIQYNLIFAKALGVKTQAEILKTTKEEQKRALEIILADEKLMADAKTKEYFTNRKQAFEIASNKRFLVAFATKQLCEFWKQSSPDTLMKEIKFSEQIKAIFGLEVQAGQKAEAEIAEYFHNCVKTDGFILENLPQAIIILNKNKKEAEKKAEADKAAGIPDTTSGVQRGGARKRYRFGGTNPEEMFMNLEPQEKAEVLRLIQELASKALQEGKLNPSQHRDVLLRLHERQCMCLGVEIFIASESLPEASAEDYKKPESMIKITGAYAKILEELLATKLKEKAKMDADAATLRDVSTPEDAPASDPLVFSGAGTQAASASLVVDAVSDTALSVGAGVVLPSVQNAGMMP